MHTSVSKVFEWSKWHKPRSSTIHEGNECSLWVFKEITNSFIISSKEAQERIKEYQNGKWNYLNGYNLLINCITLMK